MPDQRLSVPVFQLVVLGSSAGGVQALRTVVSCLPANFPVALVAVQHLFPYRPSLLPGILARSTRLAVHEARGGVRLEAGHFYLAPPDEHVLVDLQHRLQLSHAEREHFVRPAADVLFDSAAQAYGPRLLAVVLSGSGTDGNRGVRAVKACAGTVIVEDPASAAFRGMPEAAILTGSADYVLPLEAIGPTLIKLVMPAGGTDALGAREGK